MFDVSQTNPTIGRARGIFRGVNILRNGGLHTRNLYGWQKIDLYRGGGHDGILGIYRLRLMGGSAKSIRYLKKISGYCQNLQVAMNRGCLLEWFVLIYPRHRAPRLTTCQ
jgi:hypothetical protein